MAGPSKNKALELSGVSVEKPGSTITLFEKDIPEPGEGQVLVNIKIRPVRTLVGYWICRRGTLDGDRAVLSISARRVGGRSALLGGPWEGRVLGMTLVAGALVAGAAGCIPGHPHMQRAASSLHINIFLHGCCLAQVNPADIFSLRGLYPGFTPPSFPAVAGLDGMAVVVKNGPGASKFAPG